jgi:hypothetical protein
MFRSTMPSLQTLSAPCVACGAGTTQQSPQEIAAVAVVVFGNTILVWKYRISVLLPLHANYYRIGIS